MSATSELTSPAFEKGRPTMTEQPILTVEDVRLAFKGVKAIDGVSFSVGRRELFAIIGPNGAGKTSIFNVLSGVYRPQSGRVMFDGSNMIGLRPPRVAAAGIARTFQNVELFANLTVLDNLLLGRHIHSPLRHVRGNRLVRAGTAGGTGRACGR